MNSADSDSILYGEVKAPLRASIADEEPWLSSEARHVMLGFGQAIDVLGQSRSRRLCCEEIAQAVRISEAETNGALNELHNAGLVRGLDLNPEDFTLFLDPWHITEAGWAWVERQSRDFRSA